MNTDPEGKIVGTANLQLDNGKLLTYTIWGYVKDALYKIEMSDRSNGKTVVSGMGTFPLAETNPTGSSAQPSATAASNSSYALDFNCGKAF
ncbi:hypothetical protein [Methylocystis parvus]|uniref:Uncharacterized protein n=1 Tax=Methylocystis parvus TaxID=134 RepID=A0A6B8M753_9HYPH|nr:hypothetical protein [Methylocystis parvus]QGM99914.1 hypothetical protein F7D14_20190 [Methylocystis parvus]WBK02337.1 hypothetical protein MMG94_20040 [Methylocystis parvus OBBP]